MSFFSRAAGALFKLVAENVKRFTLGFLSGAACYALLLGAMAYSLLRNESPWQTYVAGVLVAVGAILAGVVTGARVAATQTLRDWVDSTGAGPMLSKVIFKQALGVSEKRPEGSKQVAAELEGMTVGQAKAKLVEKLSELFHSDALDRWLPSQGRWVAKKLTSTAGWLVVRSLVARVPGADDDHASLDLLALRDRVSDGLTDKAVSLVLGRATALSWAVILAAGVVCLAATVVLRYVA
ncbi:MAG: hypothetical protein KDA37_01935 [Planctomycetales bacterium]|nr:hypothetical protein [Planctomycetales bacterium]